MQWERDLATLLMSRGLSGYLSTYESTLSMRCHLNGQSTEEIADRITDRRRYTECTDLLIPRCPGEY